MWEYLFVLLIGFWLGVAIFLYVSCFWLEEILDLPHRAGRAHSPSASGAHAQLKRLVARVVEEAAALPALARYAADPHTPTDASTYEDLLATAILNKVIERYQTESGSGGRSSGIHSASASPSPSERSSPRSPHSLTSRDTREITPPVGDDASDWEEGDPTEGLELPKRVPFPEYGRDIVHTDNELREFDDVSGSDIQAVDGSWEENWLFQKKKIKNIQSAPVPMLVPNSNTQYRALIGDRDADDTTDLSDNGSDDDDQYRTDLRQVINSKHVIGGKTKIEDILDFEPDSLNYIDGADKHQQDSENLNNKDTVDSPRAMYNINGLTGSINNNDSKIVVSVDSGPLPSTEFNIKEEIHRTILNGHNGILSEVEDENKQTESVSTNNNGSNTNTLSRSEREKESEETMTLPVQRHKDSLRRKHFDEPNYHSTPNATKEDDLIPGSIAYRERKKWLNYVEMPNNPYSPEAIKKRLSAKSASSLFDTLTSKTEEITSKDQSTSHTPGDETLQNNNDYKKLKTSMSTDNVLEHRRTTSPSLTHLRQAVSEEVPQYKRYDRDYYVKEARSSSGACKKTSLSGSSSLSGSIYKSASLEAMETSPDLLIKQFNTIAANRQYTKFAGNDKETLSITTMPKEYNNEIIIEYEDFDHNSTLHGEVTHADEDTDKKFEEILQIAYNSDKTNFIINNTAQTEEQEKSINIENSLSSSSLGDSIKIYNVQTGEIVKCKPEDKLSERYRQNADNTHDNSTADEDDTLTGNNGPHGQTDSDATLTLERTIDDLPEYLPNVKELAKKFVVMESLKEPLKPVLPLKRQKSKENILSPEFKERPANKLTYMHSLTARSISREFREELKLSMATPLTVPGGAKVIPEGEEVSRERSRPGSPVPQPGTIRTKLAFFESLKSKFSSK